MLRFMPFVPMLAASLTLTALAAQAADLATPGVRQATPALERELAPAAPDGRVRVVVQFAEPPVALLRKGIDLRSAEARNWRDRLTQLRRPRLEQIARLGGRVASELSTVLNGAIVEIDPARIEQIKKVPGVRSVRRTRIYTAEQATVVSVGELIGTVAVNNTGVTGEGVVVAVIDSGLDYTHKAFGGSGLTTDYQTAVSGSNPTVVGDSPLFPNAKVIGGFDYVGELWPTNGGIVPDPDPIDNKQLSTDFAGHGSAVASAAAGLAVPEGGVAAGSAPGAKLLAYRGCSRITNQCEGGALLNSVEAAVEASASDLVQNAFPGRPGPVRMVINTSLGSAFNNPDVDDLSEAARNAVEAGISFVASAGNSGDIPYITGSPGSTETLIGTAASIPPSNTGPGLSVPDLGRLYPLGGAAFGALLTAPLTATFGLAGTSTVNLACSNPINLNPPAPADPPIPPLNGVIGIADRGTCQFGEKIFNMQQAGAIGGLIVNNAPGILTLGAGAASGLVTIPSFSIDQSQGTELKNAVLANPALTGTILPQAIFANPLVDQITSFSSRGPSIAGNRLKPDITAPGDLIFLANVGTGTGGAPISGTSFSSPLTAGAAALLLSKYPDWTPNQVKAALMNSASPNVFVTASAPTTQVVPLSRQGAGRVQVDKAANLQTLAWDNTDPAKSPSLSFGFQSITRSTTLTRTVAVQNLSNTAKTYTLTVTPRFSDDSGKGVNVVVPASITVGPGRTATFPVRISVDANLLPAGGLDAGSGGNSSAAFTAFEQDGFITLAAGPNDTVSLPYYLLPYKSSNVSAARIGPRVRLTNSGIANTTAQVYNLMGSDAQDVPVPTPGSEQFPVDIKDVGVRYVSETDTFEFLVNLHQPFTNPRFTVAQINVDTTGDGIPDFAIFNGDLQRQTNSSTPTGRNATFITGPNGPFVGSTAAPLRTDFFTSVNYNASQFVLPVRASSIGATPATKFSFFVIGAGSVSDFAPDPVFSAPFVEATDTLATADAVKTFSFSGSAGQRVFIELKSGPDQATANPDIVLELLDASGAVIASEDNSGGFPDSEDLDLFLPATGTYTIRVSGFEGATGEFVLTAKNVDGSYVFTPSAPVVTPTAASVNVPSRGTAAVDFTLNSANRTASPSDQGLLFRLPDNPLPLQAVPVPLGQ